MKQHEVSQTLCVNRGMAGLRNCWFFSGLWGEVFYAGHSLMSVLLLLSFSPLVPCSQPFTFFRLLMHILIAYNQSPQPRLSLSPEFQALVFQPSLSCVVASIHAPSSIT